MTHNEMIEIIAAHRDGKKIEVRWKDNVKDEWGFQKLPSWDFANFDYRIAPEPKKRLMTPKELCGKWIKTPESNPSISLVTGCNNGGLYLNGGYWNHVCDKWLYTTTPQDDNSWKSVELDEL